MFSNMPSSCISARFEGKFFPFSEKVMGWRDIDKSVVSLIMEVIFLYEDLKRTVEAIPAEILRAYSTLTATAKGMEI